MRSQVSDTNKKGFSQLAEYATYIIEELDSDTSSSGSDSIAAGKVVEERSYYRITARGVGITASSEVILQTVYKQ